MHGSAADSMDAVASRETGKETGVKKFLQRLGLGFHPACAPSKQH